MAEYIGYDWHGQQHHNQRQLLQQHQDCQKKIKHHPLDRQRAVEALRDRVGASLDLALRDKSRCQDDRFLERFLFARKHDVHEAFGLLVAYYSYRQRHPEIFQNMSPDDPQVARALQDGLPGVVAERDRRGRRVLVMFASNWNPAACPLLAVYRALWLTLEAACEDVQNLANGFVVVVDWTEFTFKQSAHMKPGLLKLIIEGLQDCFPARFKGIHFVAQPWYVETALACIKPFLRAKTRERIHLHGYNLSTLHEHLARDILPSDLGGEGPSHNTEAWLRQIAPNSKPKLDVGSGKEEAEHEGDKEDKKNKEAKMDVAHKIKSFLSVGNNSNNNGGAKAGLLNPDEDL